eukprot:IDg5894t1
MRAQGWQATVKLLYRPASVHLSARACAPCEKTGNRYWYRMRANSCTRRACVCARKSVWLQCSTGTCTVLVWSRTAASCPLYSMVVPRISRKAAIAHHRSSQISAMLRAKYTAWYRSLCTASYTAPDPPRVHIASGTMFSVPCAHPSCD